MLVDWRLLISLMLVSLTGALLRRWALMLVLTIPLAILMTMLFLSMMTLLVTCSCCCKWYFEIFDSFGRIRAQGRSCSGPHQPALHFQLAKWP